MTMKDRLIQFSAATMLFALLGLLAGCAHLSVMHLERQPWTQGETRTYQMRFLRFEYQVVSLNGKTGIKGRALPVMAGIPENAGRIEEMSLTAFVSDAAGEVVFESVQPFLPGPFKAETVLNFDFLIQPEALQKDPVFISFGYRMMIGEGSGKDSKTPFFASEGAVRR